MVKGVNFMLCVLFTIIKKIQTKGSQYLVMSWDRIIFNLRRSREYLSELFLSHCTRGNNKHHQQNITQNN